jgi:DNA-binding beta-propeller fold protein YncE
MVKEILLNLNTQNMILNRKKMKAVLSGQIFMIIVALNIQSQTINPTDAHRVTLPNGWHLSPAGKMLSIGDLPLNIAVAPSEKIAAVTNNGQSVQSIQLIDLEKQVIIDSVVIGKSWLGLTFSYDSKYLYASGGNDNIILKYSVKNNHLSISDTIKVGKPRNKCYMLLRRKIIHCMS